MAHGVAGYKAMDYASIDARQVVVSKRLTNKRLKSTRNLPTHRSNRSDRASLWRLLTAQPGPEISLLPNDM